MPLNKLSDEDQATLKKVQQTIAQDYISDSEFLERFKHAKEFAMNKEEKSGEVSMMFIAHMHKRVRAKADKDEWVEIPIVLAGWDDPKDKYEIMRGLGAKLANEFQDYMLVCVVQISEGWMATYTAEDHQDGPYLKDGVPTPSQRDDKMEVLLIDACTVDQRKSSAFIPIVRKSNGEFGTWGAERESLYDPKGKDVERENFLILNIFMGSTTAGVELMKGKK